MIDSLHRELDVDEMLAPTGSGSLRISDCSTTALMTLRMLQGFSEDLDS